jgi:hypothetical protein
MDGRSGCPISKPAADLGGECWPTIKPSKGWPLAPRLRRAKGLDRACCWALVSHQAFDGEVRNAGAGITIHLHRDDLHRLPDTPVHGLEFSNNSRGYDTTRRAVRFWGYDSAMETSFFVTEHAPKRVQPSMAFDQNGALWAFDVNRALIHATVAKVYVRGHKRCYDLVSSDF